MHSKQMTPRVGPLTNQYLKRSGYSEAQIARLRGGTSLFQDLGLSKPIIGKRYEPTK